MMEFMEYYTKLVQLGIPVEKIDSETLSEWYDNLKKEEATEEYIEYCDKMGINHDLFTVMTLSDGEIAKIVDTSYEHTLVEQLAKDLGDLIGQLQMLTQRVERLEDQTYNIIGKLIDGQKR
jgi:hypothetical protein